MNPSLKIQVFWAVITEYNGTYKKAVTTLAGQANKALNPCWKKRSSTLLSSFSQVMDSWLSQIKNLLDHTGFGNVWLNPSSVDPTGFILHFSLRCEDQYRQSWESELNDSSGKLRTYHLFKKEFTCKAYLKLPRSLPLSANCKTLNKCPPIKNWDWKLCSSPLCQ